MSTTVNRHSRNFIGAIGTYGIFQKANVDSRLFNPFGDNMNGLMTIMGREEDVDSVKGTYFEDTRSKVVMHATGSVGASAGATVTQTVVAADRFTYGSADPYTASNDVTVVPPQKHDQLMFSNGVIGTVLTEPDGSFQYNIAPNDVSEIIPAVTADDEVINLGQRTEEGSGSPKPVSSRPTKFEWVINMKKKAFEVTDLASAEAVYIEYKGEQVWGFRDYEKTLEALNIEHAVEQLVGKQINNPTVLAALPEAPSGQGYIPYIQAHGRDLTYDDTAGMTKADLDQWAIYNAGVGAPKEYIFAGGEQPILEIQDELKDLSGDASFAIFSPGEDGREIAVNLNFKSLRFGNQTIHLKRLPEFNHSGMLGAKDFIYSRGVIAMPMAVKGSGKDYITVLNFNKNGNSNLGYEEKFMSGIGGNNDLEESIEKYIVTIRKGMKFKGQFLHSFYQPA